MSNAPVQPRSRELEIIRVLFDKHLLHRAVNLAEARWTGSGDVIQLAYEWRDLAPQDRRARLEQIGPERLAQFQALADLEPDLARVLEDLAGRGVLETVHGSPDTEHDDTGLPEDEDAISHDVPEDESELPSPTVDTSEPDPESWEEAPVEDGTGDDAGVPVGLPDVEDVRDIIAASLPQTDLSPESIDEVLLNEQQRRAEAIASGEEILQRVRDRLDTAARRATSQPSISPAPSLSSLPRMTAPAASPGPVASIAMPDERTFTAPPEYWLRRLEDERIVVVDGTVPAPSDDELVAIANDLGIGIEEFDLEPGLTRALFGGLRRTGTTVEVEVGQLPAALAHGCLAVVRGRFMPHMLERLRKGLCDIPGTRATVRIADETRVLVIP